METMRAAVFKEVGKIVVEDRPIPQIASPEDAIVKVKLAGVCGSDLHWYHFIPGHEFVGTVAAVGDGVKTVKPGDDVVVSTTRQLKAKALVKGDCLFAVLSKRLLSLPNVGNASTANTNRRAAVRKVCFLVSNRSYGIGIDGGQAEYVKVPFADTTLVLSPESVRPELLVLMSDIFPTGYFCASRYLKNMPRSEAEESVVVVVGCGPVGICAIAAALTWCPTVYAVDLVPERLAEAEKIGAKALLLDESVEATIKAATNGRGADVVLEVVGNHDAMQLSLAMVRPFGYISCVGVYLGNYTFSGPTLHAKNMTIAWGRCPVKGIFQESLDCLAKVQDKVGFLCDLHMPLEDASQAYEIFNQRKAHKIILDML
ncbi:hypothetical protein N7533_010495 [Penicillium manginii]|uniref:uncharacterized protein n=1 Tax=Penicillium manginii TaxID=203109 RepID=UPI00254832D7|nr:uncharacterized protein N7533_010495 [Penicillium manginii]KAJ5743393.1 hypothetical protein N7533_010495 [Penicillium manginii]